MFQESTLGKMSMTKLKKLLHIASRLGCRLSYRKQTWDWKHIRNSHRDGGERGPVDIRLQICVRLIRRKIYVRAQDHNRKQDNERERV